MGNGLSNKTRVVPFTPEPGSSKPSTSSRDETCGMCGLDGNKKIAKWWCENCHDYICNYCAWNHSNKPETSSHRLTPTEYLQRRKLTPTWQEKLQSKQAILSVYFDTKADLHYVDVKNYHDWNQYEGEEHVRGQCLLPQCNTCGCRKRYVPEAAAVISGCAFLPGGYMAVTDFLNEELKLFNSNYDCTSFLKFDGSQPVDICSHGNDLYIAMSNQNKIMKVRMTLPLLCMGRKLTLKGEIRTDGYCDSIAIYRHSKLSHGLIVGITIPGIYNTKRHQVHILSLKGSIRKTLYYDNEGNTLFQGKVFVSGSRQIGEVIISDTDNHTVQGFNMKTGEITFEHHIEKPLGVTTDKRYNIYVITNACFYWIPPNRQMIVSFMKRGHRSRATNCCFEDKGQKLAITSSNSETVQIYKIMSFVSK